MKKLLILASLGLSIHAFADVKLPAIFGSHMVLQRDIPLCVWGWASPGEEVKVSLADQSQSAKANAEGKWNVQLAPIAAGENLTLTVQGNNTLKLEDILIGDVWICSGQSNMEWTVNGSKNADPEKTAANYPKIRLFTVAKATSTSKRDDVSGEWKVCTPETVGDFSGVGYFFGRDVYKATNLPMGLIHSSWGGTPAEAWTDLDALKAEPSLTPMVDQYEARQANASQVQGDFKAKLEAWAKQVQPMLDPANEGEAKGYAKADFDDSQWKPMPVPGFWEQTLKLDFDGALWARKTIDIPESMAGQDLKLSLGAIDDWDTTYFNGEKVGETGATQDAAWRTPRTYTVPKALVHAGKNVIAIRIYDMMAGGGLSGPANVMKLSSDNASVNLTGEWKYMIERESKVDLTTLPAAPLAPRPEIDPANLYNAMIHPLIGFGLKGVIWYQGENNAPRAFQYRTLLPTMISNWRHAWNEGNFPFLIVQLANYAKDWTDPNAPDAWAELREAQYLTAKNLPHCGMACIIDVGEPKDIHPKDKQTVGARLALQAQKKVYAQDVEDTGPEYKSMEVRDNRIILHFDHAKGLTSNTNEPRAFAIAGEDRQFKWAKAKIVGETIEVWSDDVKAPVAVRYAWGSNPAATVYNAASLPAIPFRTDDWPMSTK